MRIGLGAVRPALLAGLLAALAAVLTVTASPASPLTVVDLETISYPERSLVPASIDAELARIVADLPSGATLLVIAPGSTAVPPHLQFTLAVLGLDVMTGSRLQLDTPFGLSMIQSGRYYGIGGR